MNYAEKQNYWKFGWMYGVDENSVVNGDTQRTQTTLTDSGELSLYNNAEQASLCKFLFQSILM
jgi:hypothetical protein